MKKINVFKYKQYRDGNPNDVNARVSHVNYVIDGVNENFEMQPEGTFSDSYVSLIKTNKSMVFTTPFGTTELEGYKVCGLFSFDGSANNYSEAVFTLELATNVFLPGNSSGSVSCDLGSPGGDEIIQTMQNSCYVSTGSGLELTDYMDFYNDYGPTGNPNLPYYLDVYVEAGGTSNDFTANIYYEYEFYLIKDEKFNFIN